MLETEELHGQEGSEETISATPLLKRISPSVVIYLLIGVVIVILRLLIKLFPEGQIAPQMVNLTDTLSIGGIWVVGWVGVYLGPGTGFSGMWPKEIPLIKRLLFPAVVGVGIGILSIVLDLIEPLGSESLIKFPASLVAYPLAGILEEIIFRLFLTTTLVWIFSNMLLRGRWQEGIFWVVAVFLGVFYTLSQLSQFQSLLGGASIIIAAHFFLVIGAYFILAAYFYRRYGFLAALAMMLGDYLIWHILWGAIAKG
jgi:hypothetical protein